MEKINGVHLLGILAGQNLVILISGVCLIRHPRWKKIPKNNKHPRTYIHYRRVHTNTYVDRVSNFAAENVFNKALFCSTMNVTKSATINDKGSYKICWKSLLKTMKSTMNPTNNDKEFLKESLTEFSYFRRYPSILNLQEFFQGNF